MIESPTNRDVHWKRVYDRVLATAERHGTIQLTTATEEEHALTLWVARQMRAYACNQLTWQQEMLLEQVPGWKWSVTDEYGNQKLRVRELARFVKVKGRTPVLHVISERPLAQWMIDVRRNFDAIDGTPLGTELAGIPGFLQEFRSPLAREVHEYIGFMDVAGRHPRNYRHSTVEHNLFRWAKTIRQQYSRGKLSMLAMLEVERIPGWSWKDEDMKTAAPREAERPSMVAA